MRVFISYSRQNQSKIENLVEDLDLLDHHAWFDREIVGGKEWWAEILEQIRRCDIFVLALSSDALKSAACERELRYALDLGKNLLPIRMTNISPDAMPGEIRSLQAVDYQQTSRQVQAKLKKALKLFPPSPELPDPLPPEPEMPISKASELAAWLGKKELGLDEQRTILGELRNLLTKSEAVTGAYKLLAALLEHPDLRASVEKEAKRTRGALRPDMEIEGNRSLSFGSMVSEPEMESRSFECPDTVDALWWMHGNGRICVVISTDRTLIWDGVSGDIVNQFDHSALASTEDGRTLLVKGSDGLASRLYDVNSGELIHDLLARDEVGFLASDKVCQLLSGDISSDGLLAATGYTDGTLRLWDAVTGKEIRRWTHNHIEARATKAGNRSVRVRNVDFVAFSPLGDTILTLSDPQLKAHLWDVHSLEKRFEWDSEAVVAFSSDGRFILELGQRGLLLDARDGTECGYVGARNRQVLGRSLVGEKRYVDFGLQFDSACIWNESGLELFRFDHDGAAVYDMALSPRGRYAVTAGKDGTVRLWKTNI